MAEPDLCSRLGGNQIVYSDRTPLAALHVHSLPIGMSPKLPLGEGWRSKICLMMSVARILPADSLGLFKRSVNLDALLASAWPRLLSLTCTSQLALDTGPASTRSIMCAQVHVSILEYLQIFASVCLFMHVQSRLNMTSWLPTIAHTAFATAPGFVCRFSQVPSERPIMPSAASSLILFQPSTPTWQLRHFWNAWMAPATCSFMNFSSGS